MSLLSSPAAPVRCPGNHKFLSALRTSALGDHIGGVLTQSHRSPKVAGMGGRCYANSPSGRLTSTGVRGIGLARFYVEIDIAKAWPSLIVILAEAAGIPTPAMHNYLGLGLPGAPPPLDNMD